MMKYKAIQAGNSVQIYRNTEGQSYRLIDTVFKSKRYSFMKVYEHGSPCLGEWNEYRFSNEVDRISKWIKRPGNINVCQVQEEM
jgi:hypothetical protein